MPIKKIYRKLFSEYYNIKYDSTKRKKEIYDKELLIEDVRKHYEGLNAQHEYFHHYFWNIAPGWLRDHREYFSKEKRAFGEDAFHAMWYFIFKEFEPKKILEIGIYRGSTLSLFSLLSQKLHIQAEVHGISPFSSAGHSTYAENFDYYKDVLKNFNHFKLPAPFLHKGFSTDKNMIEKIRSEKWDLIFIDGDHAYDVANADFIVCAESVKKGGLIILDDASLYTHYKPPFYSTAGYPGPSKVASEIDKNQFEEILSVGHNRVFKKL